VLLNFGAFLFEDDAFARSPAPAGNSWQGSAFERSVTGEIHLWDNDETPQLCSGGFRDVAGSFNCGAGWPVQSEMRCNLGWKLHLLPEVKPTFPLPEVKPLKQM